MFFQVFEGRGDFFILPILCQSFAQNLGSPDSLIQIPCHMPSHPVMLFINESSFIFRLTDCIFEVDVMSAQSVFSVSPETVKRRQSYSISLTC